MPTAYEWNGYYIMLAAGKYIIRQRRISYCASDISLKSAAKRDIIYSIKNFEKMTSKKYEYLKGLNGHFEIALYVDTFEEVDQEYARIVAQGGRSVLEPTTEPWGQRTCYIADPEGNLVEIGSFNRPFESKTDFNGVQ